MRVTYVYMIGQIVSTITHAVVAYYLVFHLRMNVVGLGMANSISNLVKLIVVIVFALRERTVVQAFVQPTKKALTTGYCEYLALSLPVILILGSEWWAYDLMTVFAAILGVKEAAAQTIITNAVSCFFEVPNGASEATCALIGNCIGAGNVELARRFFSLTNTIAVSIVICFSLIVFFGRNLIASLFTSNIEVQELSASLLMIVSVNYLFDGMQGYLGGPVRALGQ